MPINFVNYDADTIISNLVAQFEATLGITLQPSDERRLFINALAQVIVGINANINDTGNQVLLRTARGEALDAIGEWWGVERIGAKSARTTLQFTLSAEQDTAYEIPSGTRATPDGKLYFATTGALIIPAGSTEGTVEAICLTEGIAGNGYTSGQVKYIVDNVPLLASVSNTETTSGGADEETDNSFRERIRLAPESISTAGTSTGYEYFARLGSADVGDVVVYSPVNDESLTEEERAAGAGTVYIYILKSDGSIPDPSDKVLQDVTSAVTAKSVRPLTDLVIVSAPEGVDYTINFSYYIAEENSSRADEIQIAINNKVNEYIEWQDKKIGRNINPDELRKLILNAGASRVIITSPEYQEIPPRSVAQQSGEITATFEGFSE